MEEGTPIKDKPRGLRIFASFAALSLLLVGIFAYASTFKLQNSAPLATELNSKSHARTATLTLEVKNKYSERDGTPGQQYSWLEDAMLAEPHLPSTFRVVDHDPLKDYEWELYDEAGDIEKIFYGHEFVYSFEREDVWHDRFLVVNEYETNLEAQTKKISNSGSAKLYVRYVRREIRNLFLEDLDEILDAMSLHWTTNQEAGVKSYGSNYRSMLTLLKLHLSAAGDITCDHFHDGYGFLQQHAALTILFEQSLQAVNPRLALPYWDYVKDFQQFTDAGQGYTGFNNGELFTAAFFGSTDGDNHIADGRWAGLTMPKVTDLGSEVERSEIPHNAFGFLRSPWALTADEFVVRASLTCGVDGANADGAADCAAVSALTAVESSEGWMQAASYSPHGPVHILLGGALGCSAAWDAVEAAGVDQETVTRWRGLAFSYLKNGYRQGSIECTSTEGCYCPSYGIYMDHLDRATNFLSGLPMGGVSELTDDQLLAVVDAVCNSGIVLGDNLQSSSSWTPEFWPIHGNVERLYQLWRLQREADTFVWGEKNSWSLTQFDCTGHGENDVVLVGRDAVQVKGVKTELTVAEFLDLLEPANMHRLDYIYDNPDWAYCGEDLTY
uniref:Tyrosinase copper-binding domain-containing protein n=1 Tax=Heterosigma akashiwo TaxID=2829 RepID=A0A7S3XKX0_HETAK